MRKIRKVRGNEAGERKDVRTWGERRKKEMMMREKITGELEREIAAEVVRTSVGK